MRSIQSSGGIVSVADERRMQVREVMQKIDHFTWQGRDPSGAVLRGAVANVNCFGALLTLDSSELPIHLPNEPVFTGLELYYQKSVVGVIAKAEIVHSRTVNGSLQIGVRFLPPDNGYLERAVERPRILQGFRPSASTDHPFRYENQIQFLVEDISRDGARLITSSRNRLLFRDSRLFPLLIHFPGFGMVSIHARVAYVTGVSGSDKIALGVRFESLSPDSERIIVKYLLGFAEHSPDEIIRTLKRAGFRPKYVKSNIDFAYVSSPEEYQEVLALRYEAYARSGKLSESDTPATMADVFDLNSKIVVAKCRGRVVGSVRITQCLTSEDRFELDESIALPKTLDRRETFEISRLCVATSFQGSDLVLGLVERCAEFSINIGARYLITSCVAEMLDYYKKLGFKFTGQKFSLATLNHIPHFLLCLDVRSMRFGYRMNPLAWYVSYGKMAFHLGRFSQRRISWYRRISLSLWLGMQKLRLGRSKSGYQN